MLYSQAAALAKVDFMVVSAIMSELYSPTLRIATIEKAAEAARLDGDEARWLGETLKKVRLFALSKSEG